MILRERTAVPDYRPLICRKISLYSYMAFGGESPTYGVSVTSGSGEEAVTMDEGHGFFLSTDDDGILMLSDSAADDMYAADDGPNLATADYQWTLHVMDDSQGGIRWTRVPGTSESSRPTTPRRLNSSQ